MELIPNLSIALVIYNEELHLDDCLKSIIDLSDDIIILHDGPCSDKSRDIALKYGVSFLEMERKGMCEAHRIESINRTRNEWVLIIDADERPSKELRENLFDLVNNDKFDAYEFIWPLYNGERVLCEKWPRKKSLFRKSKLRYIDFPHMDFKTNGVCHKTNLILHHFPNYDNYTYHSFKTKWSKWAKIQAKLTINKFDTFNKIGVHDLNDWSNYFKFKRNFPELFLIFGFYDFYKSLVSGGWSGGLYTLKSSFMWGAYNSMVYFYVMLNKWKN